MQGEEYHGRIIPFAEGGRSSPPLDSECALPWAASCSDFISLVCKFERRGPSTQRVTSEGVMGDGDALSTISYPSQYDGNTATANR